MPAGLLVTVPEPVPLLLTFNRYVFSVKLAVTDRAVLMATVQVPVPEQPPPLQPVKVEPVEGVEVKVTEVL